MQNTRDVIVVGGGVIGLSCALRLRQAGARVTLVERGEIGRAASWAGAGMVEAGSGARTDPLAELRRASVGLYPRFCEELRKLSGIDPEWTPCGSLDLIVDANQAASAQRERAAWEKRSKAAALTGAVDAAHEFLRVERVGTEALRAREPNLAMELTDALYTPGAAHVRNPRLLRGLRAACEAVGVELIEQVGDVRLVTEAGALPSVACDAGAWQADAVVVAAGAWSSGLHPVLSDWARVRPVRGQILALAAAPGTVRHIIQHGQNYLVPRRDGLVLVGSSEEDADFDVRTTDVVLAKLQAFAVRTVPALAAAPRVAAWAGPRPASADGRPYIGPCRELPGVFIATGHFRSGLTLAPITAALICAAILRQPSPLPLDPFLPRRVTASEKKAVSASDPTAVGRGAMDDRMDDRLALRSGGSK